MKNFIGLVLLAVGIAAIALCLVLRSQLQTVVTQGTSPNLDTYPLLQLVLPKMPASRGTPDPAELASRIRRRIHAIGAMGLVLSLAGAVVLVMRGRRAVARASG